jgi:transposase
MAQDLSKTNPSFHYLKRIDEKNPKNYTKLSAILDLKTKKFLAMRIRTTPRHDMQDVKYLLKRVGSISVLCGDSGYDAEWLHELCYLRGVQTFIPPRKNVRLRKFRKRQMVFWDKELYGKRSNVESGFSAIKRKYGGTIRAKRIQGMRAEILLRGIAHNLGLVFWEIFDGA